MTDLREHADRILALMEGERIEGWAEEGVNDDGDISGESRVEYLFVPSDGPAPVAARRATLILHPEEE